MFLLGQKLIGVNSMFSSSSPIPLYIQLKAVSGSIRANGSLETRFLPKLIWPSSSESEELINSKSLRFLIKNRPE